MAFERSSGEMNWAADCSAATGPSLRERFPGLTAALERLPAGTILDGEIVALRPDGTQDFTSLLRGDGRKRALAFVAFDLLFTNGQSVMAEECATRRDRLRPLIMKLADPKVIMSEGVVGGGIEYFQRAAPPPGSKA